MHNLQSKKSKCYFCRRLHYVYDYDFVYVFVFEYVYEYEYEFVFEYVYVFDLKRGAQKRARRTSRPFPSGQKKRFFLFFSLDKNSKSVYKWLITHRLQNHFIANIIDNKRKSSQGKTDYRVSPNCMVARSVRVAVR